MRNVGTRVSALQSCIELNRGASHSTLPDTSKSETVCPLCDPDGLDMHGMFTIDEHINALLNRRPLAPTCSCPCLCSLCPSSSSCMVVVPSDNEFCRISVYMTQEAPNQTRLSGIFCSKCWRYFFIEHALARSGAVS